MLLTAKQLFRHNVWSIRQVKPCCSFLWVPG